MGVEDLAVRLSAAVSGRPTYSKTRVHAFLRERDPETTDDLTRAFSALLSLPYPIRSASSPEEAELWDVAHELLRRDPVAFRKYLSAITELITALRRVDNALGVPPRIHRPK